MGVVIPDYHRAFGIARVDPPIGVSYIFDSLLRTVYEGWRSIYA